MSLFKSQPLVLKNFLLTFIFWCGIYVKREGESKMGFSKRGKNSYRYECQINGKRYSKTVKVYDKTNKEIRKDFERWKMELEVGTISNQRYTFQEFSDIWIKDYCEPSHSPIVVKGYKRILKNWILPDFGNKYMDIITPIMINGFLAKLQHSYTKYATRENRPISNGTIKKIYEVLRTIFSIAYRNDVIVADPCGKVKLELKKEIDTGIHYWTKEEYQRALFLLQGEKTGKGLVVEMALMTGLRRSEIFGLTWEDIDGCRLIIHRTRQKVDGKMVELPCKTASSARYVSMPPNLMYKLNKYRNKHSTQNYIFENIDYDNVTAWFREWERKQNLTPIKFHELRHTHATLLLQEGIDVKTISQRLGHSNITTTLNTYAHVVNELDEKASQVFERISQM